MALHTLEICSGVGMLGEGLRAGLAHMGIQTRTVCHIEREAFAAAVLASRIEEGSMDAAPIWSDLLTFDAGAWSGAVDCIVAGFPCQDLSLAGRRAGLDGKRSGLFFNILDIADSCGAQFLFLENVAGIASATATVVDEAEGELEERAAARVMGELAERGWNAEWLTLSAASVGASHKRERWFCWAWRVDDPGCVQRRTGHEQDRPSDAEKSQHKTHNGPTDRGCLLGNTELHGHPAAQDGKGIAARNDGDEAGAGNACELARPNDADGQVDNTNSNRSPEGSYGRRSDGEGDSSSRGGYGIAQGREILEHTGLQHKHPKQWIYGAEYSRAGECMADPSQPRCEGREQCRALHGDRIGQETHGSTGEFRRPFFALPPKHPGWADILDRWPELAPALDKEAESEVCGMVDGLAGELDDTRAGSLRAGGNGVVALCAAAAADTLVGRMMA
jgi:DNA (cytosine-5)-methyltransferase 1